MDDVVMAVVAMEMAVMSMSAAQGTWNCYIMHLSALKN
jgi:hypothetical protein